MERVDRLIADDVAAVLHEMAPEAEADEEVSDTSDVSDLQSSSKRHKTGDEEDWIDTLGKLADETSMHYRDIGFVNLIEVTRGRSDIAETVKSVPHEAADYLDELRREGAEVHLQDLPWTKQQLEEAIEYGSHKSCDRDLPFIAKELMDFVRKGFFMVMRYEDAKHIPNLRLAPMGLVPQRDRRDRIVCDYSYWGTNDASSPTAPQEAMQFGHALQRVLQQIYDADPKHGPVHLIKVDVSDGFYRVWLRAEDAPKLAIACPTMPGQEQMVAIPTVLPMGWTQSPPYFCSLTETVADITNDLLQQHPENIVAFHRLEKDADTEPPPLPPTTPTLSMHHNRVGWHRRPLAYIDVFVDDFLGLAQGDRPRRNRIRRALLQSFDRVFRPLEADEGARVEPVSVKKLLKGDAAWATSKVLLGWLVDSLRGTIELPSHRQERLHELVTTYQGRKRASLKEWRKLLGELRSMAIALPGSAGLFTHMQAALVQAGQNSRIRITKSVRDELADWSWLLASLGERPTSIAEVVKKPAAFHGECDAAKSGMGGLCFSMRHPTAAPLLWRSQFPADTQARVVSSDNPTGDITNSDLELAGVVAQNDVMAQAWDTRHCTVNTRSDNSPAVGWTLRGSVSREGPVAYLLRLFSLHRRAYRYTVAIEHLSGHLNRMADDCSRLWNLTDSQLLEYFNSHYPQDRPWRMCHLRPEMRSALTSALRSKRSSPASWSNGPKPTRRYGATSGSPTAGNSASGPSSTESKIPCQYYKSSSGAYELDDSPTKESQYAHVLQKHISGRSVRRSPGWASKTLG